MNLDLLHPSQFVWVQPALFDEGDDGKFYQSEASQGLSALGVPPGRSSMGKILYTKESNQPTWRSRQKNWGL